MGKKSSAKIYDEILMLLEQSALSINLKNYKQKTTWGLDTIYATTHKFLPLPKQKAHLFPNIVYNRIVSKIYMRVRINTDRNALLESTILPLEYPL